MIRSRDFSDKKQQCTRGDPGTKGQMNLTLTLWKIILGWRIVALSRPWLKEITILM
jgi:hypothetical protein